MAAKLGLRIFDFRRKILYLIDGGATSQILSYFRDKRPLLRRSARESIPEDLPVSKLNPSVIGRQNPRIRGRRFRPNAPEDIPEVAHGAITDDTANRPPGAHNKRPIFAPSQLSWRLSRSSIWRHN